MKQGLLQWSSCNHSLLSPPLIPSLSFLIPITKRTPIPILATLDSPTEQQQLLTAKERRQLRNEKRESKTAYDWKSEVEEKLIKKTKKRYASWTEELNLDNLAGLGPQWWCVRASRLRAQETAGLLARTLARVFPDMEFKVYLPAVQVKTILKNGSISVKPKPLFPGCIFLKCVLNKGIHDEIREVVGIGGFIGSVVGNTKKQINLPRAVATEDIEAIFNQAKEEQEKADQAFKEIQGKKTLNSQKIEEIPNNESNGVAESLPDSKPKRRSKKASAVPANGLSSTLTKDKKIFLPGSRIRVVSGDFAEFLGSLKKLNRKTGKATVGFTLFGKESLVELNVNDIVPETE